MGNRFLFSDDHHHRLRKEITWVTIQHPPLTWSFSAGSWFSHSFGKQESDRRTGDDMKYQIKDHSKKRIRIHFRNEKLSREEAEILSYAFSSIPGVKKVTIYRATGGCALEYDCRPEDILDRLNRFRFENVDRFARIKEERISADEMKNRKLDQQLKNRLRLRILVETVADLALPMPVQLAYHVWQMITLRDL